MLTEIGVDGGGDGTGIEPSPSGKMPPTYLLVFRQTRKAAAHAKRRECPPSARGGHRVFVLRALAALDAPQMLGSGRLLAEEIAADRPLETSD